VRADHLVQQLVSADIGKVDGIIDELAHCRRWADPKLRALVAEPGPPKAKLHASLALLPVDPGQVAYLEEQLLEAGPDEALVIARRLSGTDHHREVASRLRALLETEPSPHRRFRAICALAVLDPGRDWARWRDELADGLVKQHPADAKKWLRLIRRVALILNESLEEVFLDPGRPESERSLAASLHTTTSLAGGGASALEKLMNYVLEVEGEPYDIMNWWFLAGGGEAAALVHEELDRRTPADPRAVASLARRQAHAAVVLLQLEERDSRRGPLDRGERVRADRLWRLLRDSPDPRLRGLRSYLIHRFARVGVRPDVLLGRYEAERDDSARRALLLSLGEYAPRLVPPARRLGLVARLVQDYRSDPDAGVHGAAEWLLRRWQGGWAVPELGKHGPKDPPPGKPTWYANGRGQTLTVIPGPVEFPMGSPEPEPHRAPTEAPHRRRIPRSFAIATKEVTARQFREFLKANPGVRHDWGPTGRHSPDPDGPVLGVTWFAAAQYCRWLSEREGIPEEQICYPPIPEIKDGMRLPADYLARTGYRLPTEAEWEYACRAGAVTSRPHGGGGKLLDYYAWHVGNSRGRAGRVGSLKPNDFGLFDMLGNAWEWCHDALAPYPPGPAEDRERPGAVTTTQGRVLRGGGFFSEAPELRSAGRLGFAPQAPFGLAGFRVARTWP
jgi:formylglycine-generating enzyme required for sulfatase activity